MTGWRGARLSRRTGRVTVTGLGSAPAAGARKTASTGAAADGRTSRGPGTDARARESAIAPIVVLTYVNAGGGRLAAQLDGRAGLACTTGTGLLPLCEQALMSWRLVDGGHTSALAVASVRRLAIAMINAVLLRTGATRWCETAIATRGAADAFARVFPEARFVCLHRSAPGVIRSVLRGGWGATGQAFAPYVSAHPAAPVAAVAAYWAAHAGPLLEFERANPEVTRRLMYEDLAVMDRDLAAFLGLPPPTRPADVTDSTTSDDTPAADELPVRQIPAPLLAEVNRLHAELGYPELSDDG